MNDNGAGASSVVDQQIHILHQKTRKPGAHQETSNGSFTVATRQRGHICQGAPNETSDNRDKRKLQRGPTGSVQQLRTTTQKEGFQNHKNGHESYRTWMHHSNNETTDWISSTQGMSTPLHNKLPGGSVKPTHNKEWLTGTPMEAQHKGTITATPAMTTTEDL